VKEVYNMRNDCRSIVSRYLITVFLFLSSVFGPMGCSDDQPGTPAPQEPPLTSADLLAPGPFQVASRTLSLEDTTRPTPPNGTYPGSPSRLLRTYVWYPAGAVSADLFENTNMTPISESSPFPLIIHSHGFMSWGSEGKYLAEHLAGHGYVVVSPNYPLTWFFAPGGQDMEDVVNQPGDISFLVDEFLRFNEDPGSTFHGMVDQERIGVMGLSLGGMTTSLVTYHPYLRDPRVAAAATFAGPGSMFSEAFYRNSSVPLIAIYGDIDAIVDYATMPCWSWKRRTHGSPW